MRKVTYDLHITIPVTAYVEKVEEVYEDLKKNRQKLRVILKGATTISPLELELLRIVAEKVSDVEVPSDGS